MVDVLIFAPISLFQKAREEEMVAMNSKLLFVASATVLLLSGLIVTIIIPSPWSHLSRPETDGQPEIIPIDGALGAESFAFSPQGDGPYTGVSDGRIIKWVEEERRWINFAYVSPNGYGPLFFSNDSERILPLLP